MIHVGSIETGYRNLCSRCYNEEVARDAGFDFEHVRFEPVDMSDADGVQRRFHFLLRHLGDKLSLEAFEIGIGVHEPATNFRSLALRRSIRLSSWDV